MLTCVACSMLWMNNWQVQSFRALFSHRIAVKISELACRKTFFSFKIPIQNFHKNNNSFHLTLEVANISISVTIIGLALQWKPKILLPCEILTELCNSPLKNIPFFQNADSWSLMNIVTHSILTLFTSCKHRHQYYILGKFLNNCKFSIFSKRMWPPDAVHMKHDP